jgi:3-oxoacyl-[acyl-carrier-protein] synthase II
MISSLLAIEQNSLFPILHCDSPDPKCPIRVATGSSKPGSNVLNINFSPNGQASALVVAAHPS